MTHRFRTAVAAAFVALAVLTVPAGAAQAAAARDTEGAGAKVAGAKVAEGAADRDGAVDRLEPPQRPFLIETTPTSLTVGWTPAGGPVAGYVVRVHLGLLFEPVLSTTATQATLTGLKPYTVYNVDVVATAAAGSGLADSVASPYGVFRTTYVPESEPPTAPGKPEVVEVRTNSVQLRYASATDNLHVEQYVIQLLSDGVWRDVDTVRDPSSAATSVHTVTGHLAHLTGETTYTLAMVAIDLSGNRSPRSESVTFTTGPFTAVPGCVVQISSERSFSYYNLVIDQFNTTPSAVDSLPVTFTLPIEHVATASGTAEAADLSRDGADATLSWPAGSRMEPGYGSRQLWFRVEYNGNRTLPADFRLDGSPCTVKVSGDF